MEQPTIERVVPPARHMTTARILRILEILRIDPSTSLADFAEGYNKALANVRDSVLFEDAVMAGFADRPEYVADAADRAYSEAEARFAWGDR